MADAAGTRSLGDYFSADYVTARERFRAAAQGARAETHVLPLSATGPHAEALSIDIAWLGAQQPRRLLLHTSGLHGVEAYAGSAIQLALLDAPPDIASDDALVLVHVLNPYGMCWLRRTNENNVDLNRNFLDDSEQWAGAHPIYREIEDFLNPRTPPSRDAFVLRAAGYALRFGFHKVKQAIAEGQYDFPRGLFYGGRQLEEGPQRYLAWLTSHCAGAEHLVALDVHTGLGPWAQDTLFIESGGTRASCEEMQTALGRALTDPTRGKSVAYVVRGGLGNAMYRRFARARICCLVQEMGTFGPLQVLYALREENRSHFYGEALLSHPAKQRLREALCPNAPAWRREIVRRGVAAVRALSRGLFGKGAR